MKQDGLTAARPLFALSREGIPEIVVHGEILWKVEGKEVEGTSTDTAIIARSLLKPWQFLAAEIGDRDAFWAMGLSSHSGQDEHLEQLKLLAAAAESTADDLFCPRSLPLDRLRAAQMKLTGAKPDRMYHPCSGKHLTILAACRKHGYPIQGYWNEDHPFQRKLYNLVGNQVGERHKWVVDSCGVPTLVARSVVHLNLWERLATTDGEPYDLLRNLWTTNPRLVGGLGRIDSDLVAMGEGTLLAKEGADGLLMLQKLPHDGAPAATCLVKLAGGYNPHYLALALWAVLSTRQSQLSESFSQVSEYLRSRLEEWVPRDQKFVNLLPQALD